MTGWIRNSALQTRRGNRPEALLESRALCIRELPFSGKLILQTRCDVDSASRIASSVIGQDLPLATNTSTIADKTVLWLGPLKWIIILDPLDVREIQQHLESNFSGIPCLVSDVSDARIGIAVSGMQARDLLSRVCALDLDECSFKPGQCAQSLLVRVPLLLHQVNEHPTYHLYVDRSLAHYAWYWLSDAASEFVSAGPAT